MAEDAKSGLPTQIAFHYVKSPRFRTVPGDGVVGGITPEGKIHFAVYSERAAIPQLVVHEIEPDGKVGKALDQVGKTGIVRDLEVDIVLDEPIAKLLRDWLTDRLNEVEKLTAQASGKP